MKSGNGMIAKLDTASTFIFAQIILTDDIESIMTAVITSERDAYRLASL